MSAKGGVVLRIWIAAGCVGMGACAPDYTRINPEIAVLDGFPACRFTRLGAIRAEDGRHQDDATSNQAGAGTLETWGERADEAKVLADLRRQAVALGANAVVIRTREFARDRDAGTAAMRAPERLRISAAAIDIAGDPSRTDCRIQTHSVR